ncbi:MAG: PEP-CTERM sorting domain-containing protein [Gemmataceae bacterium]
MMRFVMPMLLAAIGQLAVSGHAFAQGVLTQWNFNGPNATSVPGGTGSPTPVVGVGTAALVGGTTATFASGNASGGSTDPVTDATDFGWNTTNYAAASAENKQRGAQFNVNTAGFESLVITFDTRHSNTSSRFVQLQYSTDGTTFVDAPSGQFSATVGDTWFNNRSVDLSAITGVNDNPNFAFRIVTAFDPAGSSYVASTNTSTYGITGTLRYDMVTVTATPVPEPASILGLTGLAMGGVGLLRRRLRRS